MVAKKVNLSLYKPQNSCMNVQDSFMEVIESLWWGFTDLGFKCTFRINEVDRNCLNIAFGWVAAFYAGLMDIYPPGTILYNFEQWSGKRLIEENPVFHQIAQRFQIWDYSINNIDRWNELNPKFTPFYAKVSFSPNLIKIEPAEEDIDILYIGSLGASRAEKVTACQGNIGLNRNSVVAVSGIWGKRRDDFISRSKVLLNLSYPNSKYTVFEIVRVSYYLANRKAVVCEKHPDLEIEDDMRRVLKFVDPTEFAIVCDNLVHDSEKRKAYAEECFEVFSQRDVRDVIRDFFF